MANTPNPLNRQNLSRATRIGVSLAASGIILFTLLYIILDNAGVDALARLLIALCLPPALMAGLIGGYILIVRPNGTSENR